MLCWPIQWQVAASVLEILHHLLSDHEVRLEDFIDEPCLDGARDSLQPAVKSKPPGHTLMTYMTSDSNVLRVVSMTSFTFLVLYVLHKLMLCYVFCKH